MVLNCYFSFLFLGSPSGLSFKRIITKEMKYRTVKDYAELNGITEKTVYNRIKSGAIPKENVKKVLSTTLIKC